MSEIKKLIERLCPEGVEYRKLVDLSEVGTGSSNKQDSTDDGKYPFFVRSKFVERHNDYEYDEEAIIIPGEGGIGDIFHYINGKYALHQRVYRIHFITNSVNAKFAYYYLRNSFKKYILGKAVSATVTSIRKPMIQNFEIPVPPIEVQSKIVEILDNFTELEAQLEAELEARRKQYEYYRNQLLTFDKVGGARFDVKWMKLGEVAKCYSGATPKTSVASYWEDGTIPWMNSGEVNLGRVYKTENKITQLGYDSCSTKMVPAHTVVIALAGQGKTRGTVAITEIDLCTNQSLCAVEVDNNKIDSYYLWHYLRGQYQTLRKISSGDGTRGGLNQNMIRNFEIPVPPLEMQRELANILDRFEALTTDLQSGLPAEIEARRKQYEYYREKLLTFKRKTA